MKVNIPIALASLALSIMLWMVVYAQNAPIPVTIEAPVTLDGIDDSHLFVRKSPTALRLVVNGSADRLRTLRDERVTATVDLSRAKAGDHDYPVTISPAWVTGLLVEGRPNARVAIEEMSSRVVPVMMEGKGQLRDENLRIVTNKLSPGQVTVRGPESEVQTVREARAFLDLSQIDPLQPGPQESEVVPLDSRGGRPQHVRTSPSVVLIYYKVNAVPSDKLAQVVPDIRVDYAQGVLPDGYVREPENVTITGKPLTVANVSKVPTEPITVKNLAKTQTFRVKVLPPAGTEVVGSPYVKVTVRVRPDPAAKKPADPGDKP